MSERTGFNPLGLLFRSRSEVVTVPEKPKWPEFREPGVYRILGIQRVVFSYPMDHNYAEPIRCVVEGPEGYGLVTRREFDVAREEREDVRLAVIIPEMSTGGKLENPRIVIPHGYKPGPKGILVYSYTDRFPVDPYDPEVSRGEDYFRPDRRYINCSGTGGFESSSFEGHY